MRGGEIDEWRNPRLIRLEPAPGTKTPAITCAQAREIGKRHGARQVVALVAGKLEEGISDDGAYGMHPAIGMTGVAAAIPEKPGDRVHAAGCQRLSENVNAVKFIHARSL